MACHLEINVILHSDKQVRFKDICLGKPYSVCLDQVKLDVDTNIPSRVTIAPPSVEDPVKSVEYDLFTDIKNYHKVIIPESGRWYINMTQMVSFWRFNKESAINDAKMPIYIFTGQDMNMAMAFGVIGSNYETRFKTLEPKVGRALIVYMRRLSMQIKRGTDLYPIPDSVSRQHKDGSITEYLYFRTAADAPYQPWTLTLRDFAQHQKWVYGLPDMTTNDSLYPLWCSWTDWFSDDVTDKVILKNVKEGMKLGIRNYIIDDGWFGPGLDNDFNVRLNMGDWRPDPTKIKDMGKLVQDIKKEGAHPLIWCAPHAVAEGADCFEQRKKYLIMGEDGQLLLTSNKFHCLCFMCPEARELMADLCAGFIKEWDFDGAKYDLFNCVPNMHCANPGHSHDVTSMMEGLDKTLELIDQKSRELKKDYIVELKQNYGTPFLSRHGTMTRAGDTPYNPEGNFMRTLYVQAYSPYSINDYQTITNEDSPEAAAVVVIKMMAVGIPTYSIDFDRLTQANKDVIARYNNWYCQNLEAFKKYRIPMNAENNVFKLPCANSDIYFFVNEGGRDLELDKPATIVNGTFKKRLFVKPAGNGKTTAKCFDCFGKQTTTADCVAGQWNCIEMEPGGMLQIGL